MDNNFTVYMHISPNGKKYIGITCKKPEYRWNHGKGYKPNKHFYNAILKHGWDNFQHIIVCENLSKEDACLLEQELIKKHESNNPLKGFNHSIGGESGALGFKQSQESIEKRKSHRDYSTSWAKGKHFSEEHRRKIGDSHKGMRHSEASKTKMSESHKGFIPAWKGQKRSDEYRAKKSKAIICIETDVRYFGLMEAERQTGISHSNISNCLKGKREKAGGYHWEYASTF